MIAASFTNLPSGTRRFLPDRRARPACRGAATAAWWLLELVVYAAGIATIIAAVALAGVLIE